MIIEKVVKEWLESHNFEYKKVSGKQGFRYTVNFKTSVLKKDYVVRIHFEPEKILGEGWNFYITSRFWEKEDSRLKEIDSRAVQNYANNSFLPCFYVHANLEDHPDSASADYFLYLNDKDDEMPPELITKILDGFFSSIPKVCKKIKYYIDNPTKTDDDCFVTTAVCAELGKADDCYELTMFRMFRDSWLAKQDDGNSLIKEYYQIAPRIVEAINLRDNSSQIYKDILDRFLKRCLRCIENGKFEECKIIYMDMVNKLRKKYL